MDLNQFSGPLKYGATIDGDLTFSNAGGTITLGQGVPFIATASFGTSTAQTGVTLLADSAVTMNRKVYLTGFSCYINGPGWNATTAAMNNTNAFSITSTTASNGTFFSWGTAATTPSNTMLGTHSLGTPTAVSYGSAFTWNTGSGANEGIKFKAAGNVDGPIAGGSVGTMYVAVWGFIK